MKRIDELSNLEQKQQKFYELGQFGMYNVLKDLEKILIVKNTENQKTDGILNNKTFMFTGKLSNMSRSEAKSLIEQNSGSIVSNVTKKLDYLIVGEKPTNRKIDAAKNLKVKILDQSSWLRMLK